MARCSAIDGSDGITSDRMSERLRCETVDPSERQRNSCRIFGVRNRYNRKRECIFRSSGRTSTVRWPKHARVFGGINPTSPTGASRASIRSPGCGTIRLVHCRYVSSDTRLQESKSIRPFEISVVRIEGMPTFSVGAVLCSQSTITSHRSRSSCGSFVITRLREQSQLSRFQAFSKPA